MTYNESKKIWVAVDCLVLGYDVEAKSINVLSFKREVDPFAGQWSLIGEFIDEGEDIDEAAKRVLKKFTGLDDVFLEQIKVYGNTTRDPAGRVISILYWSLIKLDDIHKDIVKDHGAQWFLTEKVPDMVLDHNQMIDFGLGYLLSKAKNTPLGFELLPEKFTLPQLFNLYEAIYSDKLDDRNFRKKILSTALLMRLDEKDKSSSKKGAYLYQFNQKKYNELVSKGYHLELV
jgi:ADP-ribose pyrophosphatase YjhB (NUDIX family)